MVKRPDLYTVGWLTHPDFRRRGIAAAYWDHLEEKVFPTRSISALRADIRSDVADGAPFVEKRGFQQIGKTTESQLDLTALDPAKYDDLIDRITARGIVLHPLSELIMNDEDHMSKLVKLANVRLEDEPTAEDQAPMTAEMFRNYYMSSDTFYPDGWFIAADGEKYIGWCAVLPNPERPTHVSNGITVIDRNYRRIGLATAMKVHVIKHAQEVLGAEKIRTSNVSTNPMLTINKKLGYVPQYDSLEYKKILSLPTDKQFQPINSK